MHYSTSFLSTLSRADLYTRNRVNQRSICTPLCAAILSPFFDFLFSFLFSPSPHFGRSWFVWHFAIGQSLYLYRREKEGWNWREGEKLDLFNCCSNRIAFSRGGAINLLAMRGSREACAGLVDFDFVICVHN